MASTPPPSQISLKIMSPSPGVPADLAYTVDGGTTIYALKLLIQDSLESQPTPEQQRLIYRGKILDGNCTVKDALIGDVRFRAVGSTHLTCKLTDLVWHIATASEHTASSC